MQTLNKTLRDQSPKIRLAAINMLRALRKAGLRRYQARDRVENAIQEGKFYRSDI